ncbi:MAG: hypothetical protein AAFW64_10650, partial [Pseudomonadota bacterium]
MRGASAAFACVFALAAGAMERAPETLNLSYDAEAYRAWPVAFSLSANGSRSFPPQSVRCCITRSGAPGGSGTTSITITDLSGTGEIVLDVVWIEFHSEDTFEARITDVDLAEVFSGQGYGPAPLTDAEAAYVVPPMEDWLD